MGHWGQSHVQTCLCNYTTGSCVGGVCMSQDCAASYLRLLHVEVLRVGAVLGRSGFVVRADFNFGAVQ
jgi:hypothetical protein